MKIDLNADTGEGIGNDAALMPFLTSANIACGYHAGDAETMRAAILLAKQHGVRIGAHPSFPDRENFGRTEMQLSAAEVYDLVTAQLQIFKTAAGNVAATLHHVKPHGALYNQSAKNKTLAAAIARAVKDFDASLVLFGLSGSASITEADAIGLKTMNEVFADRTYQDDGLLTPRSEANALIKEENKAVEQVLQMVKHNSVTTVSGKVIRIKADTVCLHGDGIHAVSFAKRIHQTLYAPNA